MDLTKFTVNEIKKYLATLQEDNLLEALEDLSADTRKSVQQLIKKHQKMLAGMSAERQRLLELWTFEEKLYQQNYQCIVGIDEVGRGPLAGPVVAGAVILPPYKLIHGLDDSKKLKEKQREEISEIIKREAVAWAVGVVDSAMIDKINILQATRHAMQLALKSLDIKPEYVLVDGDPNPLITIPQSGIIKGDSKSASIAAASIIAKVHRDNLMKDYAQLYPHYQFEINKGYGTKKHLEAIRQVGPCPIHRKSFRPINEFKNVM